MKNIFVGGVSKSGKSAFSNKIKNAYYNHIPLDYFASSVLRGIFLILILQATLL